MPEYCDVALPVPLEANFTYRLNGAMPVIGGRVIVPFREQRLPGIVVALHDTPPKVAAKIVLTVLDASPVLDPELMKLGQWIADYYVAPLGEVFRTMLPLGAEFRRARGYRLTGRGMEALHQSATLGSSLRSPKSAEDQAQEIAVLNHLLDRDIVREESLRSATRATRETLNSLVRKKWIERVDLSAVRDATRTIRIAVLNESMEPRCAEAAKGRALNVNQNALLDALKKSGGRIAIAQLNQLPIPRTTLATLIKRGLVIVENQPADFRVSSLKTRGLDFIFSARQKAALEQINTAVAAKKFSVTLLHGITGSGKTAVYLAAMQEVLRSGRSAIMLVPEIGLTPAAAAHLHQVFGEEVAILHSGLSDAERAEQWHRIRRSEARMVVGTRSAVFAPVSDLALIVVDEEHDTSYKQEETPRYHARDVAIMRAKMKTAGAAVVLGSATPSLESYHNARTGKYSLVELPDRVERRPLPEVEILDMRQEFRETGHEQLISRKLAADIGERLARNEQIMLLLNRRGYSAFVLCRTCGDTVQCKNCAIAMTHHKRRRALECHYCGYTRPVPQTCPKCASEYVQFLGSGSEKLEEQLHGMFPQARIARLDRDTVRGRDDFEHVLSALHAGELDMVVGTQMIAKGHDIHGVTLVGVVGADLALMFPDFRSAERTFQLLAQVAGRAGRGSTPGTVILQTYFPDHYAVQYAAKHDFRAFYEKELRYRNWMRYPPFSALANVLVRSNRLDDALRWSGTLGNWLEKTPHEGIRALGPAAAPLS
ncbi:MAG: primosomal protein N', partial [Terriglobales bacterium]